MWIASLIGMFTTWWRYRASVRALAALDDRTLADIGLVRSQITAAAWHEATR